MNFHTFYLKIHRNFLGRESHIFNKEKNILLQHKHRQIEYATICAYFLHKLAISANYAKNMH